MQLSFNTVAFYQYQTNVRFLNVLAWNLSKERPVPMNAGQSLNKNPRSLSSEYQKKQNIAGKLHLFVVVVSRLIFPKFQHIYISAMLFFSQDMLQRLSFVLFSNDISVFERLGIEGSVYGLCPVKFIVQRWDIATKIIYNNTVGQKIFACLNFCEFFQNLILQ
eukprot:TRINITY_DN12086_c1_g1_i1.p1 TRINITY_DN12086_c1_g1~~TRINITY_DN12086_c1_g1_i1.p1  ORF type:complete len:163 (+),score=1.72 TRINITY_DN12086_c1_g1_i1:116-604(+)